MTITELANDIELVWSSTEKETIPKFALRTRIFGDILYLIPLSGDNSPGSKVRAEIPIDWNDVTAPVVISVTDLRDQILAFIP
jgi:hypothetical protein